MSFEEQMEIFGWSQTLRLIGVGKLAAGETRPGFTVLKVRIGRVGVVDRWRAEVLYFNFCFLEL